MCHFILYFITVFTCSTYGSYGPEIKYVYLYSLWLCSFSKHILVHVRCRQMHMYLVNQAVCLYRIVITDI